MTHNVFAGDPCWVTAHRINTCQGCGMTIKPGHRILLYPRTGSEYCHRCGLEAWRVFIDAAEAEYTATGPLEEEWDTEGWE